MKKVESFTKEQWQEVDDFFFHNWDIEGEVHCEVEIIPDSSNESEWLWLHIDGYIEHESYIEEDTHAEVTLWYEKDLRVTAFDENGEEVELSDEIIEDIIDYFQP